MFLTLVAWEVRPFLPGTSIEAHLRDLAPLLRVIEGHAQRATPVARRGGGPEWLHMGCDSSGGQDVAMAVYETGEGEHSYTVPRGRPVFDALWECLFAHAGLGSPQA